jgi:hypothetical protein
MGTRISSANQLLLGRSKIQFIGTGGATDYIAFTSDLYGPLAIAVRHSRLPFEPVSENKTEFRRPMRYVEAMFDWPARRFHVAHQGSEIK